MISAAETATTGPAEEASGRSASTTRIDFSAAATLKKWPSFKNERIKSAHWSQPYFLFEAPLDTCIREFLAKPVNQRHLYEIHTEPQTQFVDAVLSAEQIVEIARLRDFL